MAHREVAEALVLMVAPLAPHLAEELWSRLGHDESLTHVAVPGRRPGAAGRGHRDLRGAGAGKVRDRLQVPTDITEDELREQALASEAVQRALDGREVRTVVVRAPKLVNVVPV